MPSVLRSARLDLLELPAPALRHAADGDRAALAATLGAHVPPDWPAILPAEENLAALRGDPTLLPWLSRAIVLRAERVVVGEIGFHEAPDQLAVVELGYEVLPAYRRRGIAREAILALTDWAYSTGSAATVYATIDRDNAASIALVRSLGLHQDENHAEPADGPLVFFERALPLPR